MLNLNVSHKKSSLQRNKLKELNKNNGFEQKQMLKTLYNKIIDIANVTLLCSVISKSLLGTGNNHEQIILSKEYEI